GPGSAVSAPDARTWKEHRRSVVPGSGGADRLPSCAGVVAPDGRPRVGPSRAAARGAGRRGGLRDELVLVPGPAAVVLHADAPLTVGALDAQLGVAVTGVVAGLPVADRRGAGAG